MSVAFNESEPFVLRGDDVKAFDDHLRRRGWPDPNESSKFHLVLICCWVSSPVVLWEYFCDAGPLPAAAFTIYSALSGCCMVMLAIELFCYVRSWRRWRRMRKDLPRLAQTRSPSAWQVTITPEGIWNENEDAASFVCWSAVWDIYGTKDRAFIWIGQREVILVPLRSFASEAKFTEFVRQAAHCCRQDEASIRFMESENQTSSGICLLQQAIKDRPGEPHGQTGDKELIQDHP
jgi:hypothetical protein